MPVKVTYSALPSHTFSLLSVHSYLAYIAFKCEVCCDSVALIKLFPLSACLYPSCLSLLWNTNHEKSLGGGSDVKLTVSKTLSDVQWERCDCTNRTNCVSSLNFSFLCRTMKTTRSSEQDPIGRSSRPISVNSLQCLSSSASAASCMITT